MKHLVSWKLLHVIIIWLINYLIIYINMKGKIHRIQIKCPTLRIFTLYLQSIFTYWTCTKTALLRWQWLGKTPLEEQHWLGILSGLGLSCNDMRCYNPPSVWHNPSIQVIIVQHKLLTGHWLVWQPTDTQSYTMCYLEPKISLICLLCGNRETGNTNTGQKQDLGPQTWR